MSAKTVFHKIALAIPAAFLGTLLFCLGVGWAIDASLENSLRVGIVLGAVYAFAALMFVLTRDDASSSHGYAARRSADHERITHHEDAAAAYSESWTSSSDRHTSPSFNPGTGLPMISDGPIDIGGNVYGARGLDD